MINVMLLLIGFAMLIKGADIFVASSSSVAKRFSIPSIIIGMTIVAMGTSAPELSVSINSSVVGLNDMSIANVVGSNIFNILIVLGVSSLFNKLKINNYKDICILLGASILLLLCAIDGNIGVLNGITLLIVFISFIYDMIQNAKEKDNSETIKSSNKPLWLTIILGLLGLGAIIWGGDLVVDSASAIAMQLGMSENLVGLTIVAVGTSLPELVTSVIATKKGELEIAIGNVIGSNIFNILFILGTASVISPITVTSIAVLDIIIMISITYIFILATRKNQEVNKKLGIVLILIYIIYIISTIIR